MTAHDTANEDRQAIVDLTHAYSYAIDDKRYQDLRAVFTADARTDYGTIECNGIDEIIAKVEGSTSHMDATMHVVTNHRVALQGDRAAAVCYLQAQHVKSGLQAGELYTIGGRYEDELVRTDEGWRFSFRRLVRIWAEGNRGVASRG